MTTDLEWDNFMATGEFNSFDSSLQPNKTASFTITPLHISTQTVIYKLNKPIPVYSIFWQLPVLPYTTAQEGIVKKQCRFELETKDEYTQLLDDLKAVNTQNEYVKMKIQRERHQDIDDQPETAQKKKPFKDIRKISIGVSHKDIIHYNGKETLGFRNCISLTLRLLIEEQFHEFDVKVFKTGSIKICGVTYDDYIDKILKQVVLVLKPFVLPTCNENGQEEELAVCLDKFQRSFINSNFECGFLMDRDKFHCILKKQYKWSSKLDTGINQGLKCKLYYNDCGELTTSKSDVFNQKVWCTFFRTGSVNLCGKCSATVLQRLYDMVAQILREQYTTIFQAVLPNQVSKKRKSNKQFKKAILFQQKM